MLVENQEMRILDVPISSTGGRLILRPGVNAVPDEIWSKAIKDPFVDRRLRGKSGLDRTLIELGRVPEEDSGLTTLDQMEALETIKKTLDFDLLHRWLGHERRKKVRIGLQRQIAMLEAGRRKKTETE